jgi:hypothetical protein
MLLSFPSTHSIHSSVFDGRRVADVVHAKGA